MSIEGGLGLDVEYDPRELKPFTAVARRFPRELYRAQGRAASIVARKFRSAVARGGNRDTGRLAPLSPLRLALRPSQPMGGVLGSEARSLVRVQRRSGAVYAGYISRVEGVFSRWQSGGRMAIGDRARSALYRKLHYLGVAADAIEIGEMAVQPARPVTEPIAAVARREFPRWVLGNLNKMIDRTLTRKGY